MRWISRASGCPRHLSCPQSLAPGGRATPHVVLARELLQDRKLACAVGPTHRLGINRVGPGPFGQQLIHARPEVYRIGDAGQFGHQGEQVGVVAYGQGQVLNRAVAAQPGEEQGFGRDVHFAAVDGVELAVLEKGVLGLAGGAIGTGEGGGQGAVRGEAQGGDAQLGQGLEFALVGVPV